MPVRKPEVCERRVPNETFGTRREKTAPSSSPTSGWGCDASNLWFEAEVVAADLFANQRFANAASRTRRSGREMAATRFLNGTALDIGSGGWSTLAGTSHESTPGTDAD